MASGDSSLLTPPIPAEHHVHSSLVQPPSQSVTMTSFPEVRHASFGRCPNIIFLKKILFTDIKAKARPLLFPYFAWVKSQMMPLKSS